MFSTTNLVPVVLGPSENTTLRSETDVAPGTLAKELNLDFGFFFQNSGKVTLTIYFYWAVLMCQWEERNFCKTANSHALLVVKKKERKD